MVGIKLLEVIRKLGIKKNSLNTGQVVSRLENSLVVPGLIYDFTIFDYHSGEGILIGNLPLVRIGPKREQLGFTSANGHYIFALYPEIFFDLHGRRTLTLQLESNGDFNKALANMAYLINVKDDILDRFNRVNGQYDAEQPYKDNMAVYAHRAGNTNVGYFHFKEIPGSEKDYFELF